MNKLLSPTRAREYNKLQKYKLAFCDSENYRQNESIYDFTEDDLSPGIKKTCNGTKSESVSLNITPKRRLNHGGESNSNPGKFLKLV